jgi:DNA-binding NtrC family response regulator
VDDDPQILTALQRAFRKDRDRWEISVALGGVAAIQALEQESFAVVVSDMQMPEISGLELLAHVRDTFPDSLRIILSGSEEIGPLAGDPLAHDLLVKPCATSCVRSAIEQSLSARLARNTKPH